MPNDPGYIDLQVNGYAHVDFNADELAVEEVRLVCQRLKEDGVAGILATVVTDSLDTMCRRLSNICHVREADPAVREVIWGIHIEGPFLNEQPGFIGAHPVAHARPAEPDAMNRLLDAAGGITRLVTLAPERDEGARVTSMLAKQGIRVSAGHCDASLEELRRSIDAGLTMFTHLGNACPKLLPRHENIIERVLSLSDHLSVGFIADGVHVPMMALRNYIKCCGFENAFIVTDAVSGAGLGPGEYWLGTRRVIVDENWATWAADKSHLVGSAGTMQRSADNLRNSLSFKDAQIRQLMVDNPRKLLGL